MATQIPKIQRFQAPNEASAGRIDVKLPDALPGMEMQDKALQKLGAGVVDFTQKIQDDTIDTETTNLVTQYEGKYRQELEDAKQWDGNPTERYNKVDENMNKAYQEIATAGEKLPGLGRDVLARKLRDKSVQFEMHKLTQASAQQSKYDAVVLDTALSNEASGLVMSSELIHAGQPDTLKPFDMGIRRITDLVLQDGKKNGSVTADENGEFAMTGPDGRPMYVNVTGSTKQKLAAELSDKISTAMEVMVDAGQLDAANTLKEKYWNYIDPLKKKALAKNFEKVGIDQAAALLSRHPEQKKKILADFPEAVRIKIEDEASQKVHDKVVRMESDRKIRDDRAFRTAVNLGKPMIDSGAPITLTDLKGTDAWQVIEKIDDPKKRQNAINYFVVPKEDNETSKAAMLDLVAGRNADYDLRNIPEEKWNEMQAGLSSGTRKVFDRQRLQAVSETGAEYVSKIKTANDEFKKQALAMNLLKEDDFNRVSGKQFDKMVKMQNELNGFLVGADAKEAMQITRDYVAAIKKGEVFKAPERKVFNGGGTVVAKGNAPKPPSTDLKAWGSLYIREKGKAPPSTAVLKAFIEANK